MVFKVVNCQLDSAYTEEIAGNELRVLPTRAVDSTLVTGFTRLEASEDSSDGIVIGENHYILYTAEKYRMPCVNAIKFYVCIQTGNKEMFVAVAMGEKAVTAKTDQQSGLFSILTAGGLTGALVVSVAILFTRLSNTMRSSSADTGSVLPSSSVCDIVGGNSSITTSETIETGSPVEDSDFIEDDVKNVEENASTFSSDVEDSICVADKEDVSGDEENSSHASTSGYTESEAALLGLIPTDAASGVERCKETEAAGMSQQD